MTEISNQVAVPAKPATDFTRPYYCVFGIAFDHVRMADVLERAGASLGQRHRLVVSTPNVNNIVAAQVDAGFRDSVGRCNLVVADGMPLVWVARMLGIKARRIAGSDFFERLMHGEAGPLKVFFFGGPEGVAEKASTRLSLMSGAMKGAGGLYPGFGSVAEMAADHVAHNINQSRPDFLIVALGTAKGQAWIEQIQPRLHVPMISHLGAVVNFAAGTIRRAPWVLQASGMEWMWRIWEEPTLWRRYYNDAKGLFKLLWSCTLPLVLRRLASPLRRRGAAAHVVVEDIPGACQLVLSGDWTDADMQTLGQVLNQVTAQPQHIVIQAAGVTHIEQGIVALLIRLRGHQQACGRKFSLMGVSADVARTLALHCASYLVSAVEVPAGRSAPAVSGVNKETT